MYSSIHLLTYYKIGDIKTDVKGKKKKSEWKFYSLPGSRDMVQHFFGFPALSVETTDLCTAFFCRMAAL